MTPKVSTKHMKVLDRRLEYLHTLETQEEANSYDQAEISALEVALDAMQEIKDFEQDTGLDLFKVSTILKNLATLTFPPAVVYNTTVNNPIAEGSVPADFSFPTYEPLVDARRV